jgi:hypothetical protein
MGDRFLGVYWAARRESVEQCAVRLHRFLSELSASDAVLASWYNNARRQKTFLKRVEVESRDYLIDLLNRSRLRNDDKTVIEDLGFQISLSNRRDREKQATMNIHCGSYSEGSGNDVVLNLPEDMGDLRKPERMAAVLATVVRAWEPDTGGVMSLTAIRATDYRLQVPFVNWMVYVSNTVVPELPPMPQPAGVQKVDGLGSIIVVQDEPPDVANPEHARNIERVDAALKATGWNSPVQ